MLQKKVDGLVVALLSIPFLMVAFALYRVAFLIYMGLSFGVNEQGRAVMGQMTLGDFLLNAENNFLWLIPFLLFTYSGLVRKFGKPNFYLCLFVIPALLSILFGGNSIIYWEGPTGKLNVRFGFFTKEFPITPGFTRDRIHPPMN